jgi:hypothetical protein
MYLLSTVFYKETELNCVTDLESLGFNINIIDFVTSGNISWNWAVTVRFRFARYCTLLEVQDYWQNKEDGDVQ